MNWNSDATHFTDLQEFYLYRNALARIAADSPQRSEDLERKAGIAPKSEDEISLNKKTATRAATEQDGGNLSKGGFCFEFILRFFFQICRRNDILGTCKRHVV